MNAAPLAPAAAVAPSLRAKVIAGLLWSVFTSWGGRLLSLATFVVLVRYVGPPEVGLLAAAMVVLNFAELFVEQGFVSAIVQRREITPEQLGAAFVVNIALGAPVFAALAAGAPWLASAMRVE
ncbi:MAG: oligosaccharide flippase family protein, partial [Betaproteobacteria bacterium]